MMARKILIGVTLLVLTVGCASASANPRQNVTNGNAAAGRTAIQTYGCGACHLIPGVKNANGRVGPSLEGIVNQSYLAGRLPNTVDNMILWIRFPQHVEPGVAMPNMGVTEDDARDIAAHLYSMGH